MRNLTYKAFLKGGSAAAMALAIFAAPSVVAAQAATYRFNIPAQELGAALRAYGRTSRQQVVFDSRDTRGKRSAAVVGTFTADAGLQQLLMGTGLGVRQGSSGVLIVTTQGPGAAADETDIAASELEDVVVTGTNIRGGGPIGSPVLVFSEEDIRRSGAQTAAQFMETLPQNFGGGISLDTNSQTIGTTVSTIGAANNDLARATSDFSSGSSINLRGLGQGTTLILVNGRRLASAAAQYGGRPYTDISSIPLDAVESIEILTDGASAIYGADAIGGVVNFILKRDYVGAETTLSIGSNSDGDGREYRAAQTVGFGWATGNALIGYEHYERDATTVEGLPFLSDNQTINGQLSGDLIPEETADSVTVSIWQDLSSAVQAFADLAYNERATEGSSRNVYDYDLIFPGSGFGAQTADSFTVGENQRFSATLGLEADLGRTWTARIAAGLSRDAFDWRGDYHTVFPAFGQDYLTTTVQSSSSELATVDAVASGDVMSLPGGVVRLAIGAQHRADTYDFELGTIGGGTSTQDPPTAYTNSAFAEIEAPLMAPLRGAGVPFLTLSVAGRYEDYSNFGDTFNPRIGIRVAPTNDLRFRASYSTSFKAPSVQELQPPSGIVSSWRSYPAQPDGFLRTIEITGTNPDLRPETSENWTAGFEWTINSLNDLRVEATVYDITYSDRIAVISQTPRAAQFNDPALDSVRILRTDLPGAEFDALVAELMANPYGAEYSGCNWAAPSSPAVPVIFGPCSEPVSNIEAIAYRNLQNLAGTHDRGIDLTLRQDFDTEWGRFDWTLNAAYIFDHEQQITRSSPMVERVDQLFYPIDLNLRAGFGWQRGSWTVDTFVDYTDSYANTQFTPSREIDSLTTVDLNVSYETGNANQNTMLNGIRLVFHVKNLFEQEPPRIDFPETPGGVNIGYDPTNANPDLRRFSLALIKEW